MLSRGPEVEIEPYYCLPVGSTHNGVISAQLAAAAVAAAANLQNTNHNATGGAVAWSQPTSPTPINRGFVGTMSPTHANTMGGLQTMVSGVTQTGGTHKLTYPKKNDDGTCERSLLKSHIYIISNNLCNSSAWQCRFFIIGWQLIIWHF